MAPARTGRDRSNNNAVMKTDHTNRGIRTKLSSTLRIFITVVMKLMAPRIEEAPARCREKMAISTEEPLCAILEARGGYTVHPVPAPPSTKEDISSNIRAGGRSQNLMLLSRGKAISGAPSISGTSQLPNPPIITGMTMKKIITNAWAVTITLYS